MALCVVSDLLPTVHVWYLQLAACFSLCRATQIKYTYVSYIWDICTLIGGKLCFINGQITFLMIPASKCMGVFNFPSEKKQLLNIKSKSVRELCCGSYSTNTSFVLSSLLVCCITELVQFVKYMIQDIISDQTYFFSTSTDVISFKTTTSTNKPNTHVICISCELVHVKTGTDTWLQC